ETILDTIKMVQTEEPVPPSRLTSKVPRDLETICLKALNKEPKKRYETAGLLSEDLRRFLNEEPILARPTPVWEQAWKWTKRRPAIAALIGVSTLAVVGFVVFLSVFANQQAKFAQQQFERAEEERILKDIAQKHQLEAERQTKLADEQRVRAERNLQKALAAVDQMLTRVGQERLANEPRMEKVRRDLLQKALAFYEGFLQTEGKNPLVQSEVAAAHKRVGDIQEQLGENGLADKAYRSAITEYEELTAKFPERDDLLHQLAVAHSDLSRVLLALGHRQQAEQMEQKAMELNTQLVARFPNLGPYKFSLGKSYQSRSLFLQTHNQLAAADQSYAKAIDVFDNLSKDYPDNSTYERELALTKTNYGAL